VASTESGTDFEFLHADTGPTYNTDTAYGTGGRGTYLILSIGTVVAVQIRIPSVFLCIQNATTLALAIPDMNEALQI